MGARIYPKATPPSSRKTPPQGNDVIETLYNLALRQRASDSLETLGTHMFEAARHLLEEIPGTKATRASLHMRSMTQYRAALTHSWSPGEDAGSLSSATAWQYMQRYQSTIVIDVPLRMLFVPVQGLEPARLEPLEVFEEEEALSVSIARMLENAATHLLFIPLRQRHQLCGMLTIECHAPHSIGKPFPPEETRQGLELLCSLLGQDLSSRPVLTPSPEPDEDLPVIGLRMARPITLLKMFSMQEGTILLSGESGTGKTRLARWCHLRSARAQGPLEILNLHSIPPDMQMAELFGWRKGAFTSATSDMDGAVTRAEGGTLFIDELDKLSLEAQAGLLQLLDTGEFRRLGDSGASQRANVRFIVGTNVDLNQALLSGQLREDLFWRISVFPVHLPPLRERRDEIMGWSRHMLTGHGGADIEWSTEALTVLQNQSWPGNLRQLDNIIQRVLNIARLGNQEVIEEQVVREALSLGTVEVGQHDPTQLLRNAASMLVQHLLQQEEKLEYELLHVFSSYALEAAIELLHDETEAFRLFGKERLVESRNHHKTLKRERERIEMFEEAVGDPS